MIDNNNFSKEKNIIVRIIVEKKEMDEVVKLGTTTRLVDFVHVLSALQLFLLTIFILIIIIPKLRKTFYVLLRMLYFWLIIYLEDQYYKNSWFEMFWKDYLFRYSLTMPRGKKFKKKKIKIIIKRFK